jgi:response regulator RpfG family c-di-GMP phosphodiesterase
VDQLQALQTIDRVITASLDLRLSLKMSLEQALSQLHADAAGVLLHNPDSFLLTYAAGRGFHTQGYEHTSLRPGDGQGGQAALERRVIHIADIAQCVPPFARLPKLEEEGFVSYAVTPLVSKGKLKGLLEVFHRSRFQHDEEWLNFLEALAQQTAIAIDNIQLFDGLQQSNLELSLAYNTTIEGWSRALDLRDKETEGHTQRVTEMTLRLARAMGLGEEQIAHTRRGALLHDIGKMGIPDTILHKPDKLTEEEWVMMRRHPVFAHELISPIAYLRPALDIPYCHHEKWDGTGYPRGLKGEQIPLAARLFAVIDVWDALRSDRPYRPAWSRDKTLSHIKSLSGSHFDPKVVDVFFKVFASTGEL